MTLILALLSSHSTPNLLPLSPASARMDFGYGMTGSVDFFFFLKKLCNNLDRFQDYA